MKKEIIGTGKTVELAIQAALEQLEKSRDEVEVEILELPKKASFFGLIKGSEAKVKVTFSQSKAVVAQDFVKRVLDAMGIQNQVAIKEDGDNVVLSLGGEDIGAVIGRRGGTLDALQYLTGLVANEWKAGIVGLPWIAKITVKSGKKHWKRWQGAFLSVWPVQVDPARWSL